MFYNGIYIDMRDLIKRLLKEQTEETEILDKIKSYSGKNDFILSLKNQLNNGKLLSIKQIEAAKKTLKKEQYKNYIVSKGIDTYNKLIKTDKNLFFTVSPVVIGKPSETWKEKNIEDLEEFREKMSGKVYNEIKIGDKSDTVLNFIENEINNINNRVGFIDNGNWSILNKADSNYSNWIELIDDYDKKNLLGNGDYKSKVDEFFKERNIDSILTTKQKNYIKSLELNLDGKKLPKEISFADYEIMDEIFNKKENIKKRIEITTGIGDAAEFDFFEMLNKYKVPEENILNFSNPGNIVDQTFGVDGMVKMKKKGDKSLTWYPVQIKNNPDDAKKVNVFKIGGISIFPNKGGFGYYTSKSNLVPSNFFEDFSFGNPKIPSSYDYLASQGIK